ncbi:MAG: PASTA domain-containing protein, partial [Planctomycetota bacterium]
MDLSGTLLDTLTIISFSDEPTGVTYNPANGHLFFSDDQGPKSVYELDPGDDGEYDTPDDIVSDFSTQAFNSFDPEGIAFDPIAGVLFIADGTNNELYRVDPGSNGLFDGVPPTGDDQVTSFDTEALGIMDPEGVVFEPDSDNLYLVGAPVTAVAHVTREGELIRLIDISAANPINSAGLAYAPSSLDASLRSLYVVDRGVDNDVDPNENDGKIYEMSIVPLTQGNTAPVVDAGSDQTISLPNPAKLEGTLVADDGVPIAAVMTWSQVTGPGLVTFADVSAVDTTATFTLPGTYVLRLTADDGELAGSDEVTITVTGDAAVSFLDVRITGTEVDNPARSTDDVEEIDNATSSLDRFSGDLDLLFDRGQNRTNKIVGLRFNGVNVPPGATITNAYVQFQVDESTSATTSLTVEGQADDNPATFGFSNKPSPRPRTKAAVSWSPPPWTTIGEAGSDQRTPNMAAIVQEIVDRDGWSRGNSLAIMISGSGERTAVAFEGDPAAAPLLHVEYQLTVPGVVGQPQADAEVAIRDAGLMVGALTSEHSGTVPLGHVISQNPTAGSLVPEGSAVDLVISLGPVTVPDVVGLAQADAQTAIEAAGLTVGTVNQQNSVTVPVGAVISQVPVGGTQVAPGSAVDLVVSRGLATDLGEAGDFAVLGLTGAKIKIEVNNPGVIGDVGLGPNGERELKDGFIAGTFFMDPTAQTKELKTAIKGGAEAKDLAQAVADALQAASDAAALAPTQTFQDIKEARTIEADGELTVVEVNKIELKDGKVLTLRGGPDSEFVINISDKLELDNRSA